MDEIQILSFLEIHDLKLQLEHPRTMESLHDALGKVMRSKDNLKVVLRASFL